MTTRGIRFDTLTLKDALDLAILIEDEARERYEEFADQMTLHRNADAASFFRFMAANEAKHGSEIEEQRRLAFGHMPRTVSRSMLWEVEAPEYDRARAFMTPRAAMQTALFAEVKAHGFFVNALPSIRDPHVKQLFEQLRDEEIHHQELVHHELSHLPPDDATSPDDFVDEPVAQ